MTIIADILWPTPLTTCDRRMTRKRHDKKKSVYLKSINADNKYGLPRFFLCPMATNYLH